MTGATKQLSRRALHTRSAMLAAGFDLMAERPIDAIPIDDVVATAGVAKGSFFNHFTDKDGFAKAIAVEVRAEIETRITAANDGISNPVARLAGGMREATEYALTNRKRAIAMFRMSVGSTAQDHPLNTGVRGDVEACARDNLIRPEAVNSGMLFWLGLCQAMMVNVVENRLTRQQAQKQLCEMLILGLTGLGIARQPATQVAREAAERLKTPSTETHSA